MGDYRRGVELDRERDYWYVSMGPIPGLPDWHQQSKPSSYPFPTLEAASLFAKNHKQRDPQREVAIDFPDGRRWDGKAWVA